MNNKKRRIIFFIIVQIFLIKIQAQNINDSLYIIDTTYMEGYFVHLSKEGVFKRDFYNINSINLFFQNDGENNLCSKIELKEILNCPNSMILMRASSFYFLLKRQLPEIGANIKYYNSETLPNNLIDPIEFNRRRIEGICGKLKGEFIFTLIDSKVLKDELGKSFDYFKDKDGYLKVVIYYPAFEKK